MLATTQFGVDDTTGKQLDSDPTECPEGSHVGDIEVVTPGAARPDRRQGVLRPDRRSRPAHRVNPWKLFLLLEGQGVRIKLVGDVTLSPSGQVRTVFLNNPETPFTHFRLKMGTEERAVLMTPIACGPQEGNAPAHGLQRRTEDEHVPSIIATRAVQPGHAVPAQHRRRLGRSRSRPVRTPSRASSSAGPTTTTC